MSTPFLIACFIGLIMLLTFVGISSHLRSRQTLNDRLQKAMAPEEKAPLESIGVGSSTSTGPLVKFLGALGEANKPQSEEELTHIRRTLIQAGYRGRDAPLILFGAKLCLTIVLAGAFALLRLTVLATLPYLHTMFLSLIHI